MGCIEKKPQKWDLPGKFRCKKCPATADKKSKLCDAKKNKKAKDKKPKPR